MQVCDVPLGGIRDYGNIGGLRIVIKKIIEILSDMYPEPKTELNFETPFQLLVATILSAQTTDKQVNKITSKLFKQFREPEDFANLPTTELEKYIKSCGLYKNKAKNIIETSNILISKHDSKVPNNYDLLIKLPGVGRKTANVVLANAFGKDVLAVDTHVFRVSNRLGLAASSTVEGTEEHLLKNIPIGMRNQAHHWLILHGRSTCNAKKPKCSECPLKLYCKYVAGANNHTFNI